MKSASKNNHVDNQEEALRKKKAIGRRVIGGAFMFFLAVIFWNLGDSLIPPPTPQLSIVASQPPQDTDIYQENFTLSVEDIPASEEDIANTVVADEDSVIADNKWDASVTISKNDVKYQDKDVADKAEDSLSENINNLAASDPTVFGEYIDEEKPALDSTVFVVAETFRNPQNAVAYKDQLSIDNFVVAIKEVEVEGETMRQVGVLAKKAEVDAVKKELGEWLRYSSAVPAKKASSYDVQVYASPTLEKSQKESEKLREIGYKVRIKRKVIENSVFYKVRVTGFNDKDEATLAKRKLLKDKRLTAQQRQDYKDAYVNSNK